MTTRRSFWQCSQIRKFLDPNDPLYQGAQRLASRFRGITYRVLSKELPEGREKIVVLGSGWSTLYFLKQIDPRKYDVTVISPRSFFVFTPLLTAALSGTLSVRSVMEPIRNKLFWGGRRAMNYLDGLAEDVEVEKHEVTCRDKTGNPFKVAYDKLILAIGSETNTFGIPGVTEHASFLKEVEDVKEIRLKLFNCFERASVPGMKDEERKKILNFVVVGGGPAGTEAAAEIMDMMHEDLRKHYPTLIKDASVTIIEMLPGLIPMFGKDISNFANKSFKDIGVRCLMEHKVIKIDDKEVKTLDKNNNPVDVPYGSVIWASGVGQVQLAKTILKKIPQQQSNRVMRVRPDLRLIGASNVYAVGDCSYLTPPSLAERAEELYTTAQHSAHGAGAEWLAKNMSKLIEEHHVQLHPKNCDVKLLKGKNNLSLSEFKSMLESIDQRYRPPVPTAQMARQAGSYLGAAFNKLNSPLKSTYPFAPTTYGAFSYVGGGRAVVELTRSHKTPKPKVWRIMGGPFANAMWRGYYWSSQTSNYNRFLSLSDYVKTAIKGRDMTETTLLSTGDRQRQKPTP